jgi:rhodanese-related sulfurtransferase
MAVGVACVWFSAVAVGGDLHPRELSARLEAGARPTLVDVRSNAGYGAGHIPGAMNVPVAMLDHHRFTGSDWIVVYDAGLGGDEAARADAYLGGRMGSVRVDVLSGGYAAWLMEGGATTEASGFRKDRLPSISYDDLKLSPQTDIVLVDLRAATPEALTELSSAFPGRRAAKWSTGVLGKSRQAHGEAPPLLVLVDNGDGRAGKMARMLMANGERRVVVLLGGEKMLKREGRTGLQRRGPGAGVGAREPIDDEGGTP